MNLKNFYKTSDRIARFEYFKYISVMICCTLCLCIFNEIVLSLTQYTDIQYIIAIILMVNLKYSQICLSIRRYKDMDLSGWMCLTMLIPVIGFLMFLILSFTKGTKGNNKYGIDPLV